jgi:hypothetical protein
MHTKEQMNKMHQQWSIKVVVLIYVFMIREVAMRLEYLDLRGGLGLIPSCFTLLIFLLLGLNLQGLQVHLHLRLQGAGGIVTDKLGMSSIVILALVDLVKSAVANV